MQLLHEPLYDYGKLYKSADTYFVVYPRNPDEVQAVVNTARQEGRQIRVRASGHTLSGATLPRHHELLMRMNALNHYRFEEPGSITVGAGALVWDVRDFVLNYGLQLPVYHGGWAGPTVGGFVCSGGMGLRRHLLFAPAEASLPAAMAGEDSLVNAPLGAQDRATIEFDHECLSEIHGGFWENVLSITLVDGHGQMREIDATDDTFKWLFASFGQLGIIVEVKLKLLPLRTDAPMAYPLGQAGTVPSVQTEDPGENDTPPPSGGMNRLYWFSYLVAPEQEQTAWSALGALVPTYLPYARPEGGWVGPVVGGAPIGYRYLIRFKQFNPPLLYSRDEDFLLMGFMALARVGTLQYDAKLFELEKSFVDIALRHQFMLYPQAENLGLHVDYRYYYRDDTFERFRTLKQVFDPQHLFNTGVCFPSDRGKPLRASAAEHAASVLKKLLE